MSSDLLKENRKLRSQLQLFIDEARNNEEKMRRFYEHELNLLSTTSLLELIEMILYQARRAFGLDVITLILLDPEYEVTRILESNGLHLEKMPELIIESHSNNLDYIYNTAPRPRLGEYRAAEHGIFFPAKITQPGSVALLPLKRQQRLVGSMNFGSHDRERYHRDSGTAFLRRLADLVAICLENALNHERLKLVGLTDPLTRVNNRRFFDQRLGEEVAAAYRNRQPLVCMFLDVDHFKRVNDTLGHQAGDAVLIQLSSIINKKLRRNDILSRYGGEEFVALLPNTTLQAATDIAERIRELIASCKFSLDDNSTTNVTISIGLAAMNSESRVGIEVASRQLVSAADEAVYQAKSKGRDRVECVDLS